MFPSINALFIPLPQSYEEDFDEDTGGDLSAEKSPRLKPKKVVAKPLAASAAKLSAGELELLALKQAMAAENELFEVSSSERVSGWVGEKEKEEHGEGGGRAALYRGEGEQCEGKKRRGGEREEQCDGGRGGRGEEE